MSALATSALAVVALAATLGSCSGVTSYVKKERPTADLEKVELAALSFVDMDLDFLMSLQNPYPLGLRVAGVKAKFLVEGNQVFATETTEELVIKAKDRSKVPFRVNLKFADLAQVVRDYKAKESLSTEIQLVVTVRLHNGSLPGIPQSWDFPFKLTKQLPTIKPKINISGFKIDGPSAAQIAAQIKAKAKELAIDTARNVDAGQIASALGGLLSGSSPREAVQQVLPQNVDIRDLDLKFALEFTLELDNETPTAMLFSNLQFKFNMNGEPLIEGLTKEVRREGNRSLAKIRGEFSSRSLSAGLIEAFKTRRANFSIHGETKVKLPDIIRVEPVSLKFDDKGNFSLN